MRHNFARPSFYFFVEQEIQRIKDGTSGSQINLNSLKDYNTPQDKNEKIKTEVSPFTQTTSTMKKNRGTSNTKNEDQVSSLETDRKLIYDPPFRMWLFCTIRAIFDSKSMEHLVAQNNDLRIFSSVSRFPEFVYSFLGNFEFDNKKFSVKSLEEFDKDKCDTNRLQLLIGLQSIKPQKIWETSLFVDFLDEKFLIDDLHYFLHCRRLLFNGPMLNDVKASNDPIYYVSLQKIFWLIEIMFAKAPSDEIKEIRNKFINIAKQKADELSVADFRDIPIDSHMVLRIFLEYYRVEKKVKSFILKKTFPIKSQ